MIIRRRHSNIDEMLKKNSFELASWSTGQVVCGIDEVGRGCLAGPVVTAAVILPPNKTSPLLKDSKVLTHEQRLKAFSWIERHCWYGIGMAHHRLIDTHNIRGATLIAMKKALMQVLVNCPLTPQSILIDAMPLELNDTSYHGIPVYYFTQAERKSSSVAAASIVAKIKRDTLMGSFEKLFPGYFLADHKGYATAKHQESLRAHNHSIIHRMSFLTSHAPSSKEPCDENDQQTLC